MLNISIGHKALFCDRTNQACVLETLLLENLMNMTHIFHFVLNHSSGGRREKKAHLWIKGQR